MESTPNPFFSTFESKPEWMKKKVHIPRGIDLGEPLRPIIDEAKAGGMQMLVLAARKSNYGMSHFLEMELKPALEAMGCVCARTRVSQTTEDIKLKEPEDMPGLVQRISQPLKTNTHMDEKWLDEAERNAVRARAWRKKCSVQEEIRQPYSPKIFSHSLKRKKNTEEEQEDVCWDGPGRFGFHDHRPDKWKKNLVAMGEIAARTGRVLVIWTETDPYRISERFASKDAERIHEMGLNYMYMGIRNVVIVLALRQSNSKLLCELRKRGVKTALLSKPDKGWALKVLKENEKECGKKLLTDEALNYLANRSKERLGNAILACNHVVEFASKEKASFPLTLSYVKKALAKRLKNYDSENVGIRL